MMKWIIVLLLLAIGIISGCVSKPILTPTGLTFEEFVQDQKSRIEKFQKVTSKVEFRFEGTENISGSGKLHMEMHQEPSEQRLFLEIKDILGRVHFQLITDGKQSLANYPQEKRSVKDLTGGTRYLARLGISIPFSELHSLILGIVPISWKFEEGTWAWDQDSYGVLTKPSPSTIRVWVDGKTRAVKRIVQESKFEFTVSDFARVENSMIDFGHELKIEGNGRSLQVIWDDVPQASNHSKKIFTTEAPVGFVVEGIEK